MEATTDEVLLRIPARPEYGRIARVGAAALGLRQGMSFAEIDDLRLAIDEAMILLLDGLDLASEADIELLFRTDEGKFELEASRTSGGEFRDAAVHRFDAITSELIDDYDLDLGRAWLRLRKTPVPAQD